MGYTNASIRCFLCGVNILFLITGILLLCLGVALKISYYSYSELIQFQYNYFPNLVIGLGILIFALSYFGCYGIVKENACVTLTYSSLLLLIFFLELGIGVSGFVLKVKAEQFLVNSLSESISQYDQNGDVTDSWNEIQQQFYCCGINGPVDWISKNTNNNSTLPWSCCNVDQEGTSNICTSNSLNLHKVGCLSIFGQFLRTNSMAIQVIGISLAIFQLICTGCSCYLSQEFRKGYTII